MFASGEMRAHWSDRATLGRMLAVEAALAAAEAAAGVIPRGAAVPIATACKPARFDLEAIGHAARASGNVAIPLVKALTVEVARRDREAARFVHWGATSQDIIDTATVLAIRDGAVLIDRDLERAIKSLAAQARRHRRKPMAGRTWLQQALPITFGLKGARWATQCLCANVRTTACSPLRPPPCCNSAAPPARSPRSVPRVRPLPNGSQTNSNSPSPTCHGTANATASLPSPSHLA
jgi:3-carboxy-cis,cis-muconate cycloisomerase